MVKKKKSKYLPLIFISSILIVISFITGFLINYNPEVETTEKVNILPADLNIDNLQYTKLIVPAVDNQGNGVPSYLVVGIMPGSGRTLVDIDSLLFWVDTQNSIRTAKQVAETYTSKSLESYDLVYKVEANASVIGGPSAGAAIAIATIAAIQEDTLRDDVMITGSINHDGTIGPVSGIIEKANAAKQVGGTTFLVPLAQASEVTYEQREHCEFFGGVEFCSIETVPKRVSVEGSTGLKVQEVETIGEAYSYFVSQTV